MSVARSRERIFFASAFCALLLFLHARAFDFICDDAFIALRYARNLAAFGAPVYNLGERVEGFTSFVWVVLAGVGYRLGLDSEAIVTALTVLSVATVALSVVVFWANVPWYRLPLTAFTLAACAACVPIAAWAGSGLETTFFAGTLLLSVALGVRVAIAPTLRGAALAGAVFGFSTLTRPEAGLSFAVSGLVLVVFQRRRALGALGVMVAAFCAVVGPYLIFRYAYYGFLLPNTYYLKTSGDGGQLLARGLRYLKVAARDLGWFALIGGVLLCVPTATAGPGHRVRRIVSWTLRLQFLAPLPYVASVGGDFLDLYRFLVPVLPFAIALCALSLLHLALMLPASRGRTMGAAVAGAALLVGFGAQQLWFGKQARDTGSEERKQASLEPVSWTRAAARKWAAMGRWIWLHSRPDDWMAVGAAGAMPYYARIANLDMLGLCDNYVAHFGKSIGSRPGHQRAAPLEYLLARRPVFLFKDDYEGDGQKPPKTDPTWKARGYVWVAAKLTPEKHQAPSVIHRYFLMRIDRARELKNDPDLRVSADAD